MRRWIGLCGLLFFVGLCAPCQDSLDAAMRHVMRSRSKTVEKHETSATCDHKAATCAGRTERRERHADKSTCAASDRGKCGR